MAYNENDERWAPFAGDYEVSSKGRVRSLKYGKVRELKPAVDSHGYKQVKVYVDNHKTTILIHRMVARTFIPNPDGKQYINHLDNDPANNCVTNLEWCTRSENISYAVQQGRKGTRHNWANDDGRTFYGTAVELVREFPSDNLKHTALYQHAKGNKKQGHHHGWRIVR